MKIGERIKELRKKHNITQEQLAEKLGISFQAVSKWENNVAFPDITLIPVLAIFFGVTADYLFGLTNDTDEICDTDDQVIEIKMITPKNFDDGSREIGDLLRARKTLIVRLEDTHGTVKRRLLDFMMGLTYMGEYNMVAFSKNTYIISLPTVAVRNDIPSPLFSQ